MKGVIFKAFEQFVVHGWGEEFYEQLVDATPAAGAGAFVGPGTYPDEVLVAMLTTAAQRLDLPLDVALRQFGRFAFAQLARSLPGCLDGHRHPLTLLRVVDTIIHVEVKKLHPEAAIPRVLVDAHGGDDATLRYESPRRLCPLLLGLVEGAGNAFGYEITNEHPVCMSRGADHCRFELHFRRRPDGATAATDGAVERTGSAC